MLIPSGTTVLLMEMPRPCQSGLQQGSGMSWRTITSLSETPTNSSIRRESRLWIRLRCDLDSSLPYNKEVDIDQP